MKRGLTRILHRLRALPDRPSARLEMTVLWDRCSNPCSSLSSPNSVIPSTKSKDLQSQVGNYCTRPPAKTLTLTPNNASI